MSDFVPFPKIGRLSREMVITEKLDGTNAQVFVGEDGSVTAGSRNRWLSIENDNFGFARWVHEHRNQLRELGPGRHFGEWWGQGIQRGYGLKEKRFSLFNVGRWNQDNLPPACCLVVPVLYRGPFDTHRIEAVLYELGVNGSRASVGFDKPEGIIIFHTHSGALFKKTFEKDEAGKGEPSFFAEQADIKSDVRSGIEVAGEGRGFNPDNSASAVGGMNAP
jgi:hypothetical protein